MVAAIEKTVISPKSERLYSLREYLAREEKSIYKHEFHNGKIVKMPGGKAKHSEIATNMSHAIKLVIKPLPQKFRVYNSDLKIYIETVDKALYPDALVICEAPVYWEEREDLIVNPLLIVEVLSDSTRNYDKGNKFLLYETLPSFKEYVLIEQKKPSVESWFRKNPSSWHKITETNLNNSISLRSLGVSVPLVEIYDNIVFKTQS